MTFFSFLAFGSVPVLTYLFTFLGGYRDAQGIFGITCGTTILTSEYPSLEIRDRALARGKLTPALYLFTQNQCFCWA